MFWFKWLRQMNNQEAPIKMPGSHRRAIRPYQGFQIKDIFVPIRINNQQQFIQFFCITVGINKNLADIRTQRRKTLWVARSCYDAWL